jgi:large subunit ribosomal protein L20
MRDLKSSLNAFKPVSENGNNNDKVKLIHKEDPREVKKDSKQKEKEKEKEKLKKQDKVIKAPEANLVKSPESSFNSMDFDQNDLRRSTPNPEEVESAPKTTNPLLLNFIKNSNEQANLKPIEEEKNENKRRTPKLKKEKDAKEKEKKEPKESKEKKEKKDKKENKDETQKDSGRSIKKEEKKNETKKRKEKTPTAPAPGQDSDADFDMEPLSENTQKDDALDTQRTESEVKKVKKEGKGKTKPPRE